jgi:hypothetical protein
MQDSMATTALDQAMGNEQTKQQKQRKIGGVKVIG